MVVKLFIKICHLQRRSDKCKSLRGQFCADLKQLCFVGKSKAAANKKRKCFIWSFIVRQLTDLCVTEHPDSYQECFVSKVVRDTDSYRYPQIKNFVYPLCVVGKSKRRHSRQTLISFIFDNSWLFYGWKEKNKKWRPATTLKTGRHRKAKRVGQLTKKIIWKQKKLSGSYWPSDFLLQWVAKSMTKAD